MMLQASVYRIPVGRARHRELMTRSHRDPAVPRSWNLTPTTKFASLESTLALEAQDWTQQRVEAQAGPGRT